MSLIMKANGGAMNTSHKNAGMSVLVGLLLAAGGCPGDEGDAEGTESSGGAMAGSDGASGTGGASDRGGTSGNDTGEGGASGNDTGEGGASGNDTGEGGASGDGGGGAGGDDGGVEGGASGGDGGEGDAGAGSTDDHDAECAAWNLSLTALAADLDCSVDPDGFLKLCAEASASMNSEGGSCFPIWKAVIDCLVPFADKMECSEGTKLQPKAGVCEAENEALEGARCKDHSADD